VKQTTEILQRCLERNQLHISRVTWWCM